MAKTITVEYTRASDGAQMTKSVSIDVERYRKDTELGAVENFFLKGSGSGNSDILINVDDIVADLLDGRPSHAKHGIVQSLVDAAFTANAATLFIKGDPAILGFVAHIPCVVLDKYGRVKDWFVPSAVGSTFLTIPTSGEGALEVDCKVGWIVQKAIPQPSGLGENSQLGIKGQSEKPSTPTAVSGSGSVALGITIQFTKPSDAVIQYYDVYVIKADVQPTVIEPNDQPTVLDRAAGLASTGINLTQYFDEDTMELKALVAGDYFVAVVAKDGNGQVDVNESALGWSAKITIA